jgi:hypothetical protein
MLPSIQAQPMPLFQHTQMPQQALAMQPHAQMTLSSTETYQHNYNTQRIHINDNISQPFSQSSMMPTVLAPPLPTQSSMMSIFQGSKPSKKAKEKTPSDEPTVPK